jgi:proprotein convertase subtilisin/kexin type 5
MYYRSPALMQYINMSTYFMIYTKQVDNTDIDTTDITNQATQATFTISCDSNCEQCSIPITNCTSCYPSTITNSQFLQNNTCVSICAAGNYPDTPTSSCLPCQSPCSTCTSQSVCLSCLSNSSKPYFDTTTNTCIAACPTGYYGSVNVCVPCSILCKECSGNSTNCTICDTTQYAFFNNTCVALCPTGYFNVSSNCTQCDVSCLTCVTSPTNCLLCASGYVTNGTAGVCTNSCPPGSVPYNGSCGCLVNCLTCSGTYNNCTSCNQSSIYAYFY